MHLPHLVKKGMRNVHGYEDIAFAEKVGMVTIRAGKGNKA